MNTLEELPTPVIVGVEAYISEEYARTERDKLWRKVWLQAGRLEDIPEVGNYITYDILDDSVLIVRTAPDTVKAYYNVCSHRGRRLVDTPKGARNAVVMRRVRQCVGYVYVRIVDSMSQIVAFAQERSWVVQLTA